MLKLFWVRRHLKHVLHLLTRDDPTLTLSEVHCRLETSHRLLMDLQPKIDQSHLRRWERWSVILFHFRRDEVLTQVARAHQHLQKSSGPEDIRLAHGCLLRLHFRMLDVSGSAAG
ncbi:hypothetical protein [Deinococcus cellulosilyticus]|uniref:Uncharacterized protein n=1 Tax=Deinococcus cellulosilyticus (strain DSM 18568 / NBRC 106333 / KACC 11606 / 5516J-15) TaxID=1223518 RepID=A0A511MZC6_DEIC1|nr:hypothetical protein [Deinococcus cellulosilyticus]GEM45486.1 hypothetical protein DC3_11210 [Deinococcus cellulosilyticus NBRC 106333 = KACC 11606]